MKNLGMLFVALLLVACTDYEGVADDNFKKLLATGKIACDKDMEGEVVNTKDKGEVVCSDGLWKGAVESSSSEMLSEQSSSSMTVESSSSEMLSEQSSSSMTPIGSGTTINDSSVYDATNNTLMDLRDGRIYKTVTIGTQVWMAENLRYDYLQETFILDSSSFCYADNPENCFELGRLYFWSAAMDSAKVFGDAELADASVVRGVCPSGWHLPSSEEWERLFSSVGGKTVAAEKLKSSSGWDSNKNGTDLYGFSVLPAGTCSYDGWHNISYSDRWLKTYFWTSTDADNKMAGIVYFDRDNVLRIGYDNKWNGASVRCVMDEPFVVEELYECANGDVVVDKANCVDVPLSSSTPTLSSSSTPIEDPGSSKASWDYLNQEMLAAGKYGEFTDARDGQVYKTIEICDDENENCQTWMAENLNYDPGDVSSMGSYAWSGCYDNESANCSKYGRLYTWEVAMNDADCAYGKECNASLKPATPVRGVCPQGWHLPSHYEFEKLINFIDPDFGYNHTDGASSSKSGLYLKSQSGWNSSGNGSDTYGFSALPAGYSYGNGFFNSAGYGAYFWSASQYESNSYYAYFMRLHYDDETAHMGRIYEYDGYSVRCLQNSN